MPDDKRAEAMKRGRRLDETKPGSGLGLSIVTETAQMYGGTLRLDASKLGWFGSDPEITGGDVICRCLVVQVKADCAPNVWGMSQ